MYGGEKIVSAYKQKGFLKSYVVGWMIRIQTGILVYEGLLTLLSVCFKFFIMKKCKRKTEFCHSEMAFIYLFRHEVISLSEIKEKTNVLTLFF